MRQPTYLSPTQLRIWEADRDDYYLRYLASLKLPNPPQTQPMSVGSAFDAYVKSFIYGKLIRGGDARYEFEVLFEAQVEPHNRDWSREAGKVAFDAYKYSGALSDLMVELQLATTAIQMEFDVRATVGGVPLMGKPDCYFVSAEGARCIYDFKVNGYCGKSAISPAKGYVKVRDGWAGEPRSRNSGAHPKAHLENFKGITINAAETMESVNSEWADQLLIYAWSLGEEPGSENLVVGIEQLCGQGASPQRLRIASHRLRVGYDYQLGLLQRIKHAWAGIDAASERPEIEERAEALLAMGDAGMLINNAR